MKFDLLFPQVLQGDVALNHVQRFMKNDFREAVLSSGVYACLSALSGFLSKVVSDNKRTHPDVYREVQALCFWLRPATLKQLQTDYSQRIGRGVSFHIAPSNVDTLFFYSLCCGLLAGNAVVIRVSETSSEIGVWLLEHLVRFADMENEASRYLRDRLCVVSYPRDSQFTAWASQQCDVRILWGSDASIAELQQLPLKPSAIDISFGHRYSMGVVTLNSENDARLAAQRIFSDLKPFHQKACASPIALVFLATDEPLQAEFWQALQALASEAAPWRNLAIAAQDKLSFAQRLALSGEPLLATQAINLTTPLLPLAVSYLTPSMLDWHPGQGCLLSLSINQLDELDIFAHCQTVATFGLTESQQTLLQQHPNTRRVCALGSSLSFSSTWDGIDLIAACSLMTGD